MSNASSKPRLTTPWGLSFSLIGLFVMTGPSFINETGANLFGWDRMASKVSFLIVAVGVLFALIGLALTIKSLRSGR